MFLRRQVDFSHYLFEFECQVTTMLVKLNYRGTTKRKRGKPNKMQLNLNWNLALDVSFILHTHLTRASHPPAAFKHLILISTDKKHLGNRLVFVADLFEHNTRIEKAALHLSINRGTRSIVTTVTVEGVHFCEPRGGSTVSRRRGRGPARTSPEQTRYSNNYPR